MKNPRNRSRTLATGVALAAALLMTVPATVSAVTAAPTSAIPASAAAAAAPAVAAVAAVKVPSATPVVAKAIVTPASATARRVAVRTVVSASAAAQTVTATRIAPQRRTVVRATTTSSSSTSQLSHARAILASLIAKHSILTGTTVSIGRTPGGYQAVAYYTKGQIVISPTHTASLERILAHEIWHVIDWRDNGRIDWGESVPPR